MDNLEHGSRICEFWLGPTGDRIYHFHEPYPREPDSPIIVGLPPHLPKEEQDAGFVFLFLKSNNPTWWPVIFNIGNQAIFGIRTLSRKWTEAIWRGILGHSAGIGPFIRRIEGAGWCYAQNEASSIARLRKPFSWRN